MIARVNGADLFYDTVGNGIPFMLMHGGMGLDHTSFRPWFDPLADRLNLIYYDHRGNGRSALIKDFSGIDHSTWADDADALRRHLGHEKMILLGHSCGGFIAMEYARKYGDHLSGLVLCCTAPALGYPEIAMANARAKSTPEQLQHVIRAFTVPFANDEEYKLSAGIMFPIYFKQYNARYGELFLANPRFNASALGYCTATWFPAFNAANWLPEITVPALIVAGRDDWIYPPAQGAERLHALITGSEMAVFEESSHFPFIEEQQKFLQIVGDWIGRLAVL